MKRNKAGKFEGKDIFWHGGWLKYENGEMIDLCGIRLNHNIMNISSNMEEDIWLHEHFEPFHETRSGFCTTGSEFGTLNEMRALFLKDLELFGMVEYNLDN